MVIKITSHLMTVLLTMYKLVLLMPPPNSILFETLSFKAQRLSFFHKRRRGTTDLQVAMPK